MPPKRKRMITVAEEEKAISVVQRAWRAGVARTVVKALIAARRVEEQKEEFKALRQEREFLGLEAVRGNIAMQQRERKVRDFICALEKKQREAEPPRPPRFAPSSSIILGALLQEQEGLKNMSLLYSLWEPAAAVRIQSWWRCREARKRVAHQRRVRGILARAAPGARATARREAGQCIQRFFRCIIAKRRAAALRHAVVSISIREREKAAIQETRYATGFLSRVAEACLARQKLAQEARARTLRSATVPAALVAGAAVGIMAATDPPRGVLLRVLRSLAHPSLWMCSTRTDEFADTEPPARFRCEEAERVARQAMDRQFQREGCGIAAAAGDWSSVALFLLPDAATSSLISRLGIQPLSVRSSLESREAARRNEITGRERINAVHAASQDNLQQLLHTAAQGPHFLWRAGSTARGTDAARSLASVTRPQRLAPIA